MDLIVELQNLDYQGIQEFVEYRKELIQEFFNAINELNEESFIVRSKKKYIDKYSKIENWNCISSIDKIEIKETILFTCVV